MYLSRPILFTLLVAYVSADFDCLCNYHIELAVYPVMNSTYRRLGTLHNLDCVPTYKSSTHANWKAIQYQRQVGFVLTDSHTRIQTCSGDPSQGHIVAETHFLNCHWVDNQDCSLYAQIPECGTNRITYSSRCAFAKARCSDLNLHISHDGSCATPPATTHTPLGGGDAVLDFFCAALSRRNCDPSDVGLVCATDGRTYPNFCEYDKERCTHRDLHVANFGHCP